MRQNARPAPRPGGAEGGAGAGGAEAMAQDDGDPLQLFDPPSKQPPTLPGQKGNQGRKGSLERGRDRGKRASNGRGASPARYSPPRRRRSPGSRKWSPPPRRRPARGRRRADSGSSSCSASESWRSRSCSGPRGGRSRSLPRGGGGGGGGGGGLLRRRGEEITTIFVTGVPEDASDEDVRLAFEREGPVVRCNMMKRGPELVAFVRFEAVADMKKAMQGVREGKVEVRGTRLRAEIARQNTVTNGR